MLPSRVTQLRAWWAARQGLLALDRERAPGAVLERTGWARSVGGVNPYMTLFARAGTSRAEAERAAADREIHELPSARGCTYVVPRSDFALALKVGQGFSSVTEVQAAKKHLGVTEQELQRLCEAVLGALGGGPQDPAALKAKLGDAVRNLGEAGKKRGMTTTLPLALGQLQAHGSILRQPVDGRLDQQRYAYVLWTDSPLRADGRSAEEAYVALARRYFSWTGPASAAHFQWFSGLGVKAAKAAMAPLGLVPLAADSPLVELGGLQDLMSHAIVDRGRVIGLWEYDPEAQAIAWASFVEPTAELRAEVERTQAFVRDQLGDARSFSLDSPEKRRPRIAALRQARV